MCKFGLGDPVKVDIIHQWTLGPCVTAKGPGTANINMKNSVLVLVFGLSLKMVSPWKLNKQTH